MARQLKDFLNKHQGKTAWLFGKGPSLSLFNFAAAGPLRVAINDVIGIVPDCVYGFACDSVGDWADLYQPHHVLFSPKRTLQDAFLRPVVPECELVEFSDWHFDDNALHRTREDMAEMLQIRRGTLGSALQILHVMGVRKIMCIGIDGGQAHAQLGDHQWRTRLRNEHYKDYNDIRDHFILGASQLDMAIEFWGVGYPEPRRGSMKVEIYRNVFVRGRDYSPGVFELLEPDARALIETGKAALWKPPVREQPVIETATITHPADVPEQEPVRKGRVRSKKAL